MTTRLAIPHFTLANPLYKNASVAFMLAANGQKTALLATLFSAPSGITQLANPQKLNSQGRFVQPVYIEDEVIGSVTGISVPSHDTGIIRTLAAIDAATAAALAAAAAANALSAAIASGKVEQVEKFVLPGQPPPWTPSDPLALTVTKVMVDGRYFDDDLFIFSNGHKTVLPTFSTTFGVKVVHLFYI